MYIYIYYILIPKIIYPLFQNMEYIEFHFFIQIL